MEISLVPGSISDQNREEQVCKPLSLTGIKVEDKDLHAFDHMKRRGRVILKFKDGKLRYQVMANRKKLMEKKSELLSVKKCQMNPCFLVFQQRYKCAIDG